MVQCCAFVCSNTSSANAKFNRGITFHRFPKDAERRREWLLKIRRENFSLTSHTRICSQHFVREMFVRTGQTNRLKQNAVPTLFDFTLQQQRMPVKRKPPTLRTFVLESPVEKTLQEQEPSCGTESDYQYHVTSPQKLKRKVEHLMEENASLRKRVRTEQTRRSRLKNKVDSLKAVVKTLQDKNLVTGQCAELLYSTFSGVSADLMQRLLKQKQGKQPGKYSKELRSFAMTLNFYSAKAYKFVSKTFNLGQPHPSLIRQWYSAVNGDPGFSEDVFKALRAKASAAKRDGQQIFCGLMLDDMSIRKHVQWDGKKFRGFVDLGTGVDDDSVPEVTYALVLMVVGLSGTSWKVPCGYFLVAGLSGEEKANLVTTCLQKLSDVGIKVKSFTCDGTSSHFRMLKTLGASFDLMDLNPSFPHPCESDNRVCVFLDACHMLKLVRNTLAEQGQLKTQDGDLIQWKYLEELHALQEKESFRLANKLRGADIDWKKQKMKVNLAAQTLSSSVADAIEFCRYELKQTEFTDSEATVKCLVIFDQLFDVLNSRNPLGKWSKAPLRASTFSGVDAFLSTAEGYIYSLKLNDQRGTNILKSNRKIGFLGFLACIKSVRMIVSDLLMIDPSPMQYLLTYRMSQDYLGLFFGAVRSAGGYNNNPTAQQFAASYRRLLYRRLLMRNQIKGGNGNCLAQDKTRIPETVEEHTRHVDIDRRYDTATTEDATLTVKEEACEMSLLKELLPASHSIFLSQFKESVISYIAGYVVDMVKKKIKCEQCTFALTEKEKDADTCSTGVSLVRFKNRGGLVFASPSVQYVCLETEKCVKKKLITTKDGIPKVDDIVGPISTAVLKICLSKHLFPSLDNHMFDTTPTTNYVTSLIKCCAECFLKIRMFHLGKHFTEKITGNRIRKQFSKLILFKNQ